VNDTPIASTGVLPPGWRSPFDLGQTLPEGEPDDDAGADRGEGLVRTGGVPGHAV